MKGEPPKIIVIHDGLEQDEPLLVELREKYGDENVVLESDSGRGLEYVLSNLSQKMIVLLDLQFKGNEPSGVDVFDRIRQQTSLIYVIVWTANNVPAEDLIKFINNDALAFISATDSTERILQMVDKAAHALETRVASVLEQWISSHDEQTKNAPYLTTETGQTFSLAQLLQEIRHQTPVGMRMERNILLLAVDLLARNKERVHD
jgi:DNA-binding NarL/FixJ family response regulator